MSNFPHSLEELWPSMTFNGPTPSLDNSLGSTPASGPSNDQLPETPIEQSQTQSWPLSKDLDDNVPAVDTSDAAIAAFAAIDHRLPEARINQFQPQSTPLLKGSNNPVPAPDTPPAAIAASAAPNNQRPGFGTKQSQPSYGLQRTADEAESPSLDPSAYSRSVSRPLSVNERVAHHVPKSNGSSDAEPRSPLVSTPYSEFVPIYHKVLAKLTHPKTRSAAEDVLINFEKRIPLTVEECHIMYTLYHHVTDARGDELARRDICAVLGFMRGKLYYDREAEALFMKFRLSSEVQTVISTSVDSNLEWWKTCARIEYYGYLVEMGKLVRRLQAENQLGRIVNKSRMHRAHFSDWSDPGPRRKAVVRSWFNLESPEHDGPRVTDVTDDPGIGPSSQKLP